MVGWDYGSPLITGLYIATDIQTEIRIATTVPPGKNKGRTNVRHTVWGPIAREYIHRKEGMTWHKKAKEREKKTKEKGCRK